MATTNTDENSINDAEKSTLEGAGVDINGGSSEEIVDKVVDVDMQVPKDEEMKDAGINFVSPEEANKEDLSALAEEKMRATSAELENEFKSELAVTKSSQSPADEKAFIAKKNSLSELLVKIQEKLGLKKSTVKKELGSLKEMKDSITKDIEEIKKLESSQGKIQEEMAKIDTISHEVEEIEEELTDKV